MNQSSKTTGDDLTGAEYTQLINEIQNAITALGLTLANVDNQLAQAFARNASGGASYTDNGSANAYSLQPIGTAQKVTAYRNGDVFRFKATNANTGASTLAIDGLSAKQITKNGFTDALTSGDVLAGQVYSVYYDSTSDKFVLFTSTKERTKEILLDEIDATNGGANNLSNIDITWNSSWDNYDRIVFLVEGLVNNTSGQVGWVLSNDAGSSWLTFVDSSGESQTWTDTVIPSNTGLNTKSVMELGNNQKAMECYYAPRINSSTIRLNVTQNSNQGFGFQYNGSALTNSFTSSFVNAWHTPSNGLTGHLLRLAHDGAGAFTAGTIKIIGYNYP